MCTIYLVIFLSHVMSMAYIYTILYKLNTKLVDIFINRLSEAKRTKEILGKLHICISQISYIFFFARCGTSNYY